MQESALVQKLLVDLRAPVTAPYRPELILVTRDYPLLLEFIKLTPN